MDWTKYKALCDKPFVFSRWALTVSAQALPQELAAPLEAIMRGEPLPKPTEHKAPPELDMFELDVGAGAASTPHLMNLEYVSAVSGALSGQARERLATSLRAGQIDHLLVVWRELEDYLGAM